jgi:hypothetical protein
MQKFDDNKNIRTYKDSVIIGRLLRYARPVIWYFVLALSSIKEQTSLLKSLV